MDIQGTLKEIKDQLAEIKKSEREMERSLDRRFGEIIEKIHGVSERLSVDVAGLKTSATIWGAMAGFLPSLMFFIFDLIKNK